MNRASLLRAIGVLLLLVPAQPASGVPDDNWSPDYANPYGANWVNYDELYARPLGTTDPSVLYAGTTYNGDLVVGGDLSQDEHGTVLSGVARWDGAAWQPLGVGIDGDVRVLYEWGGNLYAGGDFTMAGIVATNDIAYWSGTSWNAVPGPSSGTLHDLIAYDGSLIACGDFADIGGVAATGIAAWNGVSWSALGVGLGTGTVRTVWVHDGLLHAGGDFQTASGGPADFLAVWGGASWASIPGSPDGPVHAITTWQGDLVVGGEFTDVGGVPGSALCAASYDGVDWAGLGYGLEESGSGTAIVRSFASDPEFLIACGDFDRTGEGASLSGGTARWTGARWERMGEDRNRNHGFFHDGALHTLGSSNSTYVGTQARKWTPPLLRPLGLWYTAHQAVEFQGRLHIGIGGSGHYYTPTKDVARFEGTGWVELGLDAEPRALAVWNGLLVASADPPQQVQAWDGSVWTPMDAGLPAGTVPEVFQEYDGALYCGLSSTGSPTEHLWRWSGSVWETVPGVAVNGPIAAMAEMGGELYFAGDFGQVGTLFVRRIAAYDGVDVRKLGVGLEYGEPLAMQVFEGNLIVGGTFESAGPVVAAGLAGYDGASWFALGDVASTISSSPRITGFTIYHGRLMAAGAFTSVAGVAASNVAAYDGTIWSPLGSGVYSGYSALNDVAVADGSLWVTGYMLTAGGKVSRQVARWTESTTSAYDPFVPRLVLPHASPNPFRASTTLEITLEHPSHLRAEVLDVQGRLVRSLVEGQVPAGPFRIHWDGLGSGGQAAAPGVYFLSVERDGLAGTRRVVRLR